MHAKKFLLFFAPLAIALAGTAHAQVRPNIGPTNPNRTNQDLENVQQIQAMDEQRRLDEMRRRGAKSQQSEAGTDGTPARDVAVVQAQVAKFMHAIKRRKNKFADFDQVVIHGKAPMTPEMLGVMAESPYAADVAYHLGTHPEQAGEIAQMQPEDAGAAVRQLAATIETENVARK